MKFDGTFQYLGNHGIVFNVSQITLTDSDRGRLSELHFGEAKSAHYEVNRKVVEVYDKMLAKNLPCQMMIGISKPLTRQQGDTLNAQRTRIANLAASAFAGATAYVATPYVGAPVGIGVRMYVNDTLPTYHAGDVLVSIEAQVNGGIGPQRTVSTLIIKT
ncbi:hypothetical protein AU074_29420 [Pseudomonas sp. ATCC PTA-122608]|uniref:hypothetical protein n=1 Tax=Pseudomonas sp. ATCC PTA-122608 TaxID=1771311 RepID=UPI00096BC191|nr:hypothetical protein [Pseudomonas sp. ATCC PTA-122608]OLY73831.1 hypothetical protein AU074_29420 [Pseudomonas sp. ATCC PTA-122608]